MNDDIQTSSSLPLQVYELTPYCLARRRSSFKLLIRLWLLTLAALGLAFLVITFTTGCASKKLAQPQMPVFSLVVPNGCIEEVHKGPDTYCRGRDIEHLHCYRIPMTKKVGCEQVDVNPNEDHRPE